MVRLPDLRGLRSLGFQSKLLVMLLTVSVLSVLIAGVIGYVSGTNSLRTAEQRMATGIVAMTDTTIVAVSRDAMNTIVQQDHRLARQMGEVIELARREAREALAEAAQGVR